MKKLLLALVLGVFVVHELTVYMDLDYSSLLRDVGPFEQMVHSFLELLPQKHGGENIRHLPLRSERRSAGVRTPGPSSLFEQRGSGAPRRRRM